MAVSGQFLCTNCDFKSTNQKLFKEIQSNREGRKAAVPNVALQFSCWLYQTNIAGTGFTVSSTYTLTSPDIPGSDINITLWTYSVVPDTPCTNYHLPEVILSRLSSYGTCCMIMMKLSTLLLADLFKQEPEMHNI